MNTKRERYTPSLVGFIVAVAISLPGIALPAEGKADNVAARSVPTSIFVKQNLVAWCIVPFDAKKRGPEKRAQMLKGLGISHFAYDYRAKHIPTFDEEMQMLKKYGIELTAFWLRENQPDDITSVPH